MFCRYLAIARAYAHTLGAPFRFTLADWQDMIDSAKEENRKMGLFWSCFKLFCVSSRYIRPRKLVTVCFLMILNLM